MVVVGVVVVEGRQPPCQSGVVLEATGITRSEDKHSWHCISTMTLALLYVVSCRTHVLRNLRVSIVAFNLFSGSVVVRSLLYQSTANHDAKIKVIKLITCVTLMSHILLAAMAEVVMVRVAESPELAPMSTYTVKQRQSYLSWQVQ